MSTPTVKLGGVTLGGTADYAWDMTYGVEPAEMLYTVTAGRANQVPLVKPLTMDVTGVRNPFKVDHAYVLEVLPGPNPHMSTLRLVDRRWLWGRKYLSSSYNLTRTTGNKLLLNENSAPVELAQFEDEIRYAKWSLYPPGNGSQRWTAKQILEDVFRQLNTPVRFEGDVPDVEVQDLVIDDPGNKAVQRVLQFIPGADLYMDLDGTAVVQDRNRIVKAGSEVTVGKKQTIGGDIALVSRKALRPAKVRVLFTPEVEVRFDYHEGETQQRDSLTLANVAPSPDFTLTLSNGRVVPRGTILPIETLFSTWGAFGNLDQALSFATLAQYGFAAQLLEVIWSNDARALFDPVKAARTRCAVEHWRRTFQIDPILVQRFASIRASRVSVLSTTTGTRARAEAYCDYVRRPNQRNPLVFNANLPNQGMGWAVRGYATRLEDASPAPALVSILDASTGVIRVEPQLDPWGWSDAINLGYPDGPTPVHAGEAEANRTGLDAYALWSAGKMEASFNLAIVLTVTPSGPNDTRHFYGIDVASGDVGEDGDGPEVEARVFPAVLTARFAHSDDTAEAVRVAIVEGTSYPVEQLVNESDLQAVAKATAKAIYTNLHDMPISAGSVSVDLDPTLKPVGHIGEVRHGLNGGITTTLVTASGQRPTMDLWPFMDGNTRRVILRIANDGSGT